MNYYLVKKNPDFELKMHDVLVVYKQIEMCFDEDGNIIIDVDEPKTVTISYDEKHGIQALKNIAPDLLPTKEHGTVGRDYEYKRLRTASLLAGMDLLTGTIISSVSDTHKSSDFIDWLKKVDEMYPEHDTLRLVLDNHSTHTFKETVKKLMFIQFDIIGYIKWMICLLKKLQIRSLIRKFVYWNKFVKEYQKRCTSQKRMAK